jgi:hypothetical protein
MPCIPIPPLPIPDLPDGFTLSLPFPTVDIDIPFPCCKLPPLFSLHISNPLPPLTVNPAFIQTIKAALKTAKAYYAKLQIRCPNL